MDVDVESEASRCGKARQSWIRPTSGRSHRDKPVRPSGTRATVEALVDRILLYSAHDDPDTSPVLSINECVPWRGRKVKGNAVVAFHFHADCLFGEGPTRETNAAGYLIQMANVPRNQNLVVGVKRGWTEHECQFWSSTVPCTWSVRSRQDRQIICPTRF